MPFFGDSYGHPLFHYFVIAHFKAKFEVEFKLKYFFSESTSTSAPEEANGELDEEVAKVKELAQKLLQSGKSDQN